MLEDEEGGEGRADVDVVGLTCPLLVDSSGAKLGKSGGNAVWLDAELTPPYELFQYFRRLDAPTAHTLLKQVRLRRRFCIWASTDAGPSGGRS